MNVAEIGDVRLYALAERLRVHGLDAERSDGTLTVLTQAGGEPADTLTCRPRPIDGDRLWFLSGSGEPIAEATRIIDAALIVASTVTGGSEVPS